MGEKGAREPAREALETSLQEPVPVEQEAHRSIFSSGLSKLLLGIGVTGVVGAAVMANPTLHDLVFPPPVVPRPVPMMTAGAIQAIQLTPPPGQSGGSGGVVGDISGPDREENQGDPE
jgi:hypothetical protein